MADTSNIEKIILKEINGDNLAEDEKIKLQNWIKSESKNADHYANLIWLSSSAYRSFATDKKALLQKLNVNTRKRKKYFGGLKIAASVSILVGVITSILISKHFDQGFRNVAATELIIRESQPGTKLTTVLPDGSKVKLNSGSKITYASDFGKNSRLLELDGEAYFDVRRNEKIPFVINTTNLKVKVLGTSFIVSSRRIKEDKLVGVISGTVQVSEVNGDQQNLLKSGEAAQYNQIGGLIQLADFNDREFFGWIDNELIFNDDSFFEAIQKLELWFGVKVSYQETDITPFHDTHVSATYSNPNVEEVMLTLSHVYNFTYLINENSINLMNKKEP